jgi:hypothetical protein
MEQFKEWDYVYVYYPVHRRGKAEKFSYKYNGPFEQEQKISSLIYKIRIGKGISTILPVNRLKGAHKREIWSKVTPGKRLRSKTTESTQPRGVSCDKSADQIKKRR